MMRIGLIADTHDRVPAVAALVDRLLGSGAGMILHAGDFCSPFSLTPFLKANIPVAGVFGKNDGDREGLRAFAATAVGIELFESPHSMEIGNRRILLVHDIGEVSERSLESHEIVVHGFVHQVSMRTRGETLLVCPGEACGWINGAPTAVLLELQSREVEVLRLDGARWETAPLGHRA
ncbi:MAG: metallophosphoesterase [Gemmatimonadaceae bacterium]